jgi:hypothetical protein
VKPSTGETPGEQSEYWRLLAKDGKDGDIVDDSLSEESENAVQNKVVTAAIKSLGVPVFIQTDEPEDKTALWVQLPSSEEDVS